MPGLLAASQLQRDDSEANNDVEDSMPDIDPDVQQFIDEIPNKIIDSQNKHVPISNDFREGKSYLSDDMYKLVPGTKNKFDYSQLQMLYNRFKGKANYYPVYKDDGSIDSLTAVITTDRTVGYVVDKDGTVHATNQLTVHYRHDKKDNGYHLVPKKNLNGGWHDD